MSVFAGIVELPQDVPELCDDLFLGELGFPQPLACCLGVGRFQGDMAAVRGEPWACRDATAAIATVVRAKRPCSAVDLSAIRTGIAE